MKAKSLGLVGFRTEQPAVLPSRRSAAPTVPSTGALVELRDPSVAPSWAGLNDVDTELEEEDL
jgi:hypothetical protein